MKLSELVAYLNLLEGESLAPDYHASVKRFDEIRRVVENHSVQVPEHSTVFCRQVSLIRDHFNSAQNVLENLKQSLREQIQALEHNQYQDSQRLYEQEMCFETNEYILNRKLPVTIENKNLIVSRIMLYTDWRTPGLIIRPGLEKFIENLVPLDPLYLADQHEDLLNHAIESFTVEYQRRLRPYVIDDYEQLDPLTRLPKNQFGFIFIYNFLNYKPIKVFEKYLRSVFDKLRPGGVAFFTFNDCDWANSVTAAENNFMCYTPGNKIRNLCLEIGFEILYFTDCENEVFWMEIQKPGDIQSIRGGQTLAKIIALQ